MFKLFKGRPKNASTQQHNIHRVQNTIKVTGYTKKQEKVTEEKALLDFFFFFFCRNGKNIGTIRQVRF